MESFLHVLPCEIEVALSVLALAISYWLRCHWTKFIVWPIEVAIDSE